MVRERISSSLFPLCFFFYFIPTSRSQTIAPSVLIFIVFLLHLFRTKNIKCSQVLSLRELTYQTKLFLQLCFSLIRLLDVKCDARSQPMCTTQQGRQDKDESTRIPVSKTFYYYFIMFQNCDPIDPHFDYPERSTCMCANGCLSLYVVL